MHEAGAGKAVVQKALDWYYGTVTESLAQREKAAAERRAEAETSLRREWGGDHERNLTFAQRAVRSFGDDTFVHFLERQEVEGVKLDPKVVGEGEKVSCTVAMGGPPTLKHTNTRHPHN